MLIIQDKLISLDLVEEQFVCALDACQGACCWEGDYGAPLNQEEIDLLTEGLEQIKPYLSESGWATLEEKGIWEWFNKGKFKGTALQPDGACSFMTLDDHGTAQCGIERAFQSGDSSLQKPISCHLYPIRVSSEPELGFEALNYDRWDICSAACAKGKAHKVAVYQFAREALIRKYGAAFYEELDAAARHLGQQGKPMD